MDTKTFKFDKLVRDKIPKLMLKEKTKVKLKQLSNKEELLKYLKLKLQEEVNEVDNSASKHELIEELADCLEIVYCLARAINESFNTIEQARRKKLKEKGGFKENIIIESINLSTNDPRIEYFIKNPNKYPEIQ